TKLEGYCPDGECPDGMINHASAVQRVSLGHAIHGVGIPDNPLADANVNDIDARAFITGDILEIYQNNTVRLTTTTSDKVRFEVDKDPSINAMLIANSGKVIVNGTEYSGLSVSETSTTYVLEYTLAGGFADDDEVRLSLQI